MSAPTSLPPPSNASRAWLKALHALSPTSLFAVKKQLSNEPRKQHKQREPPPPMPALVMETLVQIVDFLEENHRREEGLYRRHGVSDEVEKLKRVCLDLEEGEALPNLAAYNPHSITGVIKEVLGQEFEPLIPYDLSQVLVERVAEQDEIIVLGVAVDKFKQILPQTRDFLKISTSIPCRMNAKSLAENVGLLLVRPTEETSVLSSKDLNKRRRHIARLLIENATVLPYDSASDFVIPDVSEATAQTEVNERAKNPEVGANDGELHYVQIIWNPETNPHSEATLQEQIIRYGHIVNLAFNESSNRALVAFRDAASALAVAEAQLPGLKIRRRYPRGVRSDSNASIASNDGSITERPTTDTTFNHNNDCAATSSRSCDADGNIMVKFEPQRVFLEDMSFAPITDDPDSPTTASPTFLHKLQRPPSMLLERKAIRQAERHGDIALEDIESPPSSPTHHGVSRSKQRPSLNPINEVIDDDIGCEAVVENDSSYCLTTEKRVIKKEGMDKLAKDELDVTTVPVKEPEVNEVHQPQRRKSLKELLRVDTKSTSRRQRSDNDYSRAEEAIKPTRTETLSPPHSSKASLIRGLKSKFSKVKVSTPKLEGRTDVNAANTNTNEFTGSAKSDNFQDSRQAKLTRTKKTQTTRLVVPTHDQGTDTDDIPTLVDVGIEPPEKRSRDEPLQLEILLGCLRKVQMELHNLKSAIAATQRNDINQAIMSAHENLLQWVDKAIGYDSMNLEPDGPSPTSEFVSFIETRTKTQVRILEAELRAGQELLRLHKTQHQKELDELESQVASLRVANKEAERLCAELRSDLRKSRTELNCSIAAAASIKREKRDVEERLVIAENKVRVKEIETQELKAAHAEMQEIAAHAQIRLDEHRGSATHPLNEKFEDKQNLKYFTTRAPSCPNALIFLNRQDHSNSTHPEQCRPGQYRNTDELRQMKVRLQEQIDSQIKATKAVLNEMQDFGSIRQCDGEEDLEQLQQQLESACADMNAIMDESRRKLNKLDDPVFSLDCSISPSKPRFDPTTLVHSLLENALSLDTPERQVMQNEANAITSKFDDAGRLPSTGLEVLQNWRTSECDVRSEMYKKWIQQRPVRAEAGQRAKPMGDASKVRSSILREAQQSMQRFQDTLESIVTPTRR